MLISESRPDRSQLRFLAGRLLRRFAPLVLVAAQLCCGTGYAWADKAEQKSRRPNILLIVGDDK